MIHQQCVARIYGRGRRAGKHPREVRGCFPDLVTMAAAMTHGVDDLAVLIVTDSQAYRWHNGSFRLRGIPWRD